MTDSLGRNLGGSPSELKPKEPGIWSGLTISFDWGELPTLRRLEC
jgi:hypothetical protein